LYGMQRKNFKSRLFSKKIKSDDLDYWYYLYADALYRLKLNTELNCPFSECWVEKTKLNHLLDEIEEAGQIPPIRKKNNWTGKGDCGRRLGPVA
jgi:hypothetical protein